MTTSDHDCIVEIISLGNSPSDLVNFSLMKFVLVILMHLNSDDRVVGQVILMVLPT